MKLPDYVEDEEELTEDGKFTITDRMVETEVLLDQDDNYQLAITFEGLDEDGEWLPIPWPNYKVKKIPFGYERDPENEFRLLPIKKDLDALDQGKRYLKEYSYATVARWLSHVTGKKVTDQALYIRVQRDRNKDKRAIALRRWATRHYKAIEEAYKIETERAGAKRQRPLWEVGTPALVHKNYKEIPRSISGGSPTTIEELDDGTTPEHKRWFNKNASGRRPRRSNLSRKPKRDS